MDRTEEKPRQQRAARHGEKEQQSERAPGMDPGMDTSMDTGSAGAVSVAGDDHWATLLAGRNAVMLALVSAGIGLHAFNQFAIVAAMPLAAAELGGTHVYSWAYSLYFIGSIAGGTGAAAFRDRVGLMPSLLISCLCFLIGGLAAMAAPDFSLILAGRLLQGIADGLIVAIAYSLIPENFRAGLIAKVFAVEAMVWAGASLLGPLAGGWLAQAFSWRLSFAAVLPLLLGVAVLIPFARPEPSGQSQVKVAPFAIGMLMAGALVLSLASVRASGLMQALAVFCGAALFLAAVLFDGHIGPRLLPADAFRAGAVFGRGLVVLLLMSLSHSLGAVYLALGLAHIWGFRPIVVGAIVLLMPMTWSVVAVLAGRDPSPGRQDTRTRLGPLVQIAGFAAIALGLGAHRLMPVLAGQVLIGSGFGLAWANINRAAMAAVAEDDRARAGALLPTVSTAGYAMGAGLSGLVATATGLVTRLEMDGADILLPALSLYGLAGLGAAIAFAVSFGVRLSR